MRTPEVIPSRRGIARRLSFSGAARTAGRAGVGAGATAVGVGAGGYSTINAAVQAAASGDTVLVHAGTFSEQVELNKAVTLAAFGDGPVWINGNCARTNNIHITASNVTVKGVGAKRANEAGIRLDAASNVTIDGVTVQDYNCAEGQDQLRAGI